MEINHSNRFLLSFLIPFLVAYLGSKGVFYFFAFEYSLFSDAFDMKKALIEIGVFCGLFYIGTIAVSCCIKIKNQICS